MNKLNPVVVSLFDGHSGAQIALNELGIIPRKYYASEIDKHAIKATQVIFPNTIQLGNVIVLKRAMCWKDSVYNKLMSSPYISKKTKKGFEYLRNIDWSEVDLITAGSPCQGFSFAGKQLAFDDPRSKLFFIFVDILNHIKKLNPKVYFLLENVKMKKLHKAVITQFVGINPIEINSALVSAQNRERYYWTNIHTQADGLFGDLKCIVPQPNDLGILLKDILETFETSEFETQEEFDEYMKKYFLSEKMLKYFETRAANFNQGKVNIREEEEEGKASCLTSSMSSCDISDNFVKVDTNLKKSANQDKANCFTAGGNSGGLHSDMTLIVASRGRNPENPKSRKTGEHLEQHLEPRFDGKTNCLTSVQKDNLVMHIPEATKKGFIEVKPGDCFDFENTKSETRRGRKMESKSNCLMAKETDFMHFTTHGQIRRLTPRECGRLQTIPEPILNTMLNSGISDTQLYKMFGNGWTISVITHIFSFLPFKNLSNEK